MKKVTVHVGINSYDVLIGSGLLSKVGESLRMLGCHGKAVVITDVSVNELYGPFLEESLTAAGFETLILTLPPGEKQKTLANAGRLCIHLSEYYTDRATTILALGGGVIGDLAGFVAATYMRGVPLVQVPTTLLAQVDSSIGGKVAVDHGRLKNMIGVFYQPRLVIADTGVLKSLEPKLLSDGMSEVVKYGIIADADFFKFLENNVGKIMAFDEVTLEEIVHKSAEIKARVVEQDEKDMGLRNILNFGHTVGHAIESVTNFRIGHGEAISLGMLAASTISLKLGVFSRTDLYRLEKLLKSIGLPVELPDLKIELLLQVMQHDKKITAGAMKFILAKGIGKAVISNEVSLALAEQVLRDWHEKT